MRRALPFFAMTVIAMSQTASAWAADSYGPAFVHDEAQSTPTSMLTWPGKTARAPLADVRETSPPQTAPIQAQPAQAEPARATPTSLYDTPPPRWRANDARPVEPPPLPPAPSPAPTQSAGAGQPPHFYSVARQYGVQPDPVQLSSQFLAETPQADMAEPPPLPPPHTLGAQSANMSTAAATNQMRQAQEAAADADSAALGN